MPCIGLNRKNPNYHTFKPTQSSLLIIGDALIPPSIGFGDCCPMIIRCPSSMDVLTDVPNLVSSVFPPNSAGTILPVGSFVLLSFTTIMLRFSEEKYLYTITRLADKIGHILDRNMDKRGSLGLRNEKKFFIAPLILPPTSSNKRFIMRISSAVDHLKTIRAKNIGNQYNALDIGLSLVELVLDNNSTQSNNIIISEAKYLGLQKTLYSAGTDDVPLIQTVQHSSVDPLTPTSSAELELPVLIRKET